jgi:glutamate synthase domain-containing protein 1
MCGIVGYFDKSAAGGRIGDKVLAMLTALGCRGPDSAGVAMWDRPGDGLRVRVKLADDGHAAQAQARGREVLRRARTLGRLEKVATQGELLGFEIAKADPVELAAQIESVDRAIEVVSMGRRLSIVKQVGVPANLEASYGVSKMTGTHALGHTRLSTESKVDLSHSQPFWAHGTPDLAVVHNGHITNYHRLRRLYEQEDVRFYTENDSEVIGVYLGRKLREGLSLREALEASMRDLDGSFSYLAATADAFGFAKDPFCLKPLIVGETDGAIAIANEEIALSAVLGTGYRAQEAGASAIRVWDAGGRGIAAKRPSKASRSTPPTSASRSTPPTSASRPKRGVGGLEIPPLK